MAGGNRTKWVIELSPRIIAANAEAAAAQQAERERIRRQEATRDLPDLEAKLTKLEAEGADPERLKLARLEVENTRLLTQQDAA